MCRRRLDRRMRRSLVRADCVETRSANPTSSTQCACRVPPPRPADASGSQERPMVCATSRASSNVRIRPVLCREESRTPAFFAKTREPRTCFPYRRIDSGRWTDERQPATRRDLGEVGAVLAEEPILRDGWRVGPPGITPRAMIEEPLRVTLARCAGPRCRRSSSAPSGRWRHHDRLPSATATVLRPELLEAGSG